MEKYTKLLKEYSKLKDEILEHTNEFYDAMLYDIEGFNSISEDEILIFTDDLENQVKAFKSILKGLKKISYTFG
ncbi:MAG: hypothetical protein ACXACY_19240 [Candidatus Hodarchaeales archaeon]|jgi:hypothetical protein